MQRRELYWETKKISAELQKSNHEQTALIRAYLREAAQLYVEGEPWKTRITDRRLCRNTILNHLQMAGECQFWLREQGEPLAERSLWDGLFSPGDSGCAGKLDQGQQVWKLPEGDLSRRRAEKRVA